MSDSVSAPGAGTIPGKVTPQTATRTRRRFRPKGRSW